jgi:formiminotetrahydrofolate cyclodeaminase
MSKPFFDYIIPSNSTNGGSGGSTTVISQDTALCLNDIICNLVKGFDKEAQFDNMQNEINLLKYQLENCQNSHSNIQSQYSFGIIDTNVSVIIGEEYIKYINLYGVPEDGLFLPSLLAECI